MKRWSWIALVGLLGFLSGAARAELKEEGGRRAEWRARFAERMGLSKEDTEKLEAAFKERRKVMKPLRRDLRDAMLKLRDQVEDEAGDDALKAALERVDKARKALRSEAERSQAKLAEILPPSKRAKLLLARAGRRHAMGMLGRRAHPMGGRGHGMSRERTP